MPESVNMALFGVVTGMVNKAGFELSGEIDHKCINDDLSVHFVDFVDAGFKCGDDKLCFCLEVSGGCFYYKSTIDVRGAFCPGGLWMNPASNDLNVSSFSTSLGDPSLVTKLRRHVRKALAEVNKGVHSQGH